MNEKKDSVDKLLHLINKPGDRSNFNVHKTCWKCYNNEITIGQKQQLLDGKTVENKGKLILTEIFPSV